MTEPSTDYRYDYDGWNGKYDGDHGILMKTLPESKRTQGIDHLDPQLK